MLTFFIDKENKLIIEKYSGITRIGTVAKLMVHIWAHPDYEKDYDRIVDFEESNLVFSRDELERFMAIISENSNSMRGKAAILVKGPSSAAIVTLYEDQMKHLHKIEIFCSKSEVMNFLNVDASPFNRIKGEDAVRISIEE